MYEYSFLFFFLALRFEYCIKSCTLHTELHYVCMYVLYSTPHTNHSETLSPTRLAGYLVRGYFMLILAPRADPGEGPHIIPSSVVIPAPRFAHASQDGLRL